MNEREIVHKKKKTMGILVFRLQQLENNNFFIILPLLVIEI
jgi:hypothetical protein